MKNNIKTVELVRQIRDTQYNQIKSKSVEEQIAFYRVKAQKAHFSFAKSVQEHKERIAA